MAEASKKKTKKKSSVIGSGRERKRHPFVIVAEQVSTWMGSATAFFVALGIVLVWGITGPIFDYSNTWQLIINTGTTIITFLMVFLIQNSQNRSTMAMQLKLDELIRATEGAHTVLLDLEQLSDKELCIIRTQYQDIAADARAALAEGKEDTDIPKIIPAL